MLRKIFKSGHSAVVAISKKQLKEAALAMGDYVKVEVGAGEQITIRHGNKQNQLSLKLNVRPKLGQRK